MNETVLSLDGRLQAATVPALEHQLNEVTLLGNEHLLVDLSRVSFIGSVALRAILVTAKRLAAAGGKLAVFAPPHIAQIFTVSGLDAIVPVRLSLEEAREALTG
jgi:anti-sigma B factor antagonist